MTYDTPRRVKDVKELAVLLGYSFTYADEGGPFKEPVVKIVTDTGRTIYRSYDNQTRDPFATEWWPVQEETNALCRLSSEPYGIIKKLLLRETNLKFVLYYTLMSESVAEFLEGYTVLFSTTPCQNDNEAMLQLLLMYYRSGGGNE